MRRAAAVLGALGVLGAAGVRTLRRHLTVVTVVGGSMLPALREGDVLLARRPGRSSPRTGDVVVVDVGGAGRRGDRMVKRVAAGPGDPRPDAVPGAGPVPPGTVVVLGDNGGYDSRAYGPLPRERVLAVVVRPLPGVARRPSSGREFVRLDDPGRDPLLEHLPAREAVARRVGEPPGAARPSR